MNKKQVAFTAFTCFAAVLSLSLYVLAFCAVYKSAATTISIYPNKMNYTSYQKTKTGAESEKNDTQAIIEQIAPVVKNNSSNTPIAQISSSQTPSQTQPSTPPIQFSIYGFDIAYASCNQYDGVISYTLGNLNISVNQTTSQSFTWHVESDNGFKSANFVSTMPNSSYWFNFPSTPEYPRMLGSVNYAHDGDRYRFVITNPAYSASSWSSAVPAGSEYGCSKGSYVPPNPREWIN